MTGTRLLVALTLVAATPRGAFAGDPSVDRARRDVEAGASTPGPRRVEALVVLATLPDGPDRDRVRPAVLRTLDDASPDVRAAAASTCAAWRDRNAVAALVARVRREDDEATGAALLLAVGACGRAEDASRLDEFAGLSSVRLRAAVATSLGDLGGSGARTRLLTLLAHPGEDPVWAVRGAVLLALARCGTAADAGTVLVAYRENGGAQQWFARASLATLVAALDPDPVPVLDRLVDDEDARVSSAAAVAFVRAGRAGEVLARLADRRPRVRAAAAAAVADGGLATEAGRLVPLATSDPDRGVRWSAVLALSRLDDARADALLVEGVGSDEPQVWASAIGECQRKTGLSIGRDADGWSKALATRRRGMR